MSDIPEDIRKIANELAFEFVDVAVERLGEDEIAKAIWSERQRCAKVAEKWRDIAQNLGQTFQADIANDISQAILADNQEGE